MKNNNLLIGCIKSLTYKTIKTRWFYVNAETKEVKDITDELFQAIDSFNIVANEKRKTGEYSMVIPYYYKNGLTEYSFGCGLSHYLQADNLEKVEILSNGLSFPLSKCSIIMYTPDDIKNILYCKNAFDIDIKESLINHIVR